MSWKLFLRTHLGAIAAADFFSVKVLTLTGLVRYLVLFVTDLGTRRVQIGSVVRQAYGAWMTQVARNLMDGMDVLPGERTPASRSDLLFTDEFRGVIAAAGVKCPRLPARSPELTSIAERFALLGARLGARPSGNGRADAALVDVGGARNFEQCNGGTISGDR